MRVLLKYVTRRSWGNSSHRWPKETKALGSHAQEGCLFAWCLFALRHIVWCFLTLCQFEWCVFYYAYFRCLFAFMRYVCSWSGWYAPWLCLLRYDFSRYVYLRVMRICVMCICVMSITVMICVMPFCVTPFCIMPIARCLFAIWLFALFLWGYAFLRDAYSIRVRRTWLLCFRILFRPRARSTF